MSEQLPVTGSQQASVSPVGVKSTTSCGGLPPSLLPKRRAVVGLTSSPITIQPLLLPGLSSQPWTSATMAAVLFHTTGLAPLTGALPLDAP